MELTLVIPGLLWPDTHDGKEAVQPLILPSLSALLGRGRHERVPTALASLLSACFGGKPTLLAAARAHYDEWDAASAHCLVVDPVALHVERDRVKLNTLASAPLSRLEADALLVTLNSHFAQEGLLFHAPHPMRWYLTSSEPINASFTPLLDVIGEDIYAYMPAGVASSRWRQVLNEIQMLFYHHPVNEAREAASILPVSSIWLWGGEEHLAQAQPDFDAIFSDNELVVMVAKLTHLAYQTVPDSLSTLLAQSTSSQRLLVTLEHAASAARERDVSTWHQALLALEDYWFTPAWRALKQGALHRLNLLSQGDPGLMLSVRSVDRWKVWRSPRALATLY